MARPRKARKVAWKLKCDDFVPLVNLCIDKVFLTKEEIESLRLKDCLGLEQKKAAFRMGISQPTFHRLLSAARRKISEAIVEAKELRIR